MRYYCSPSTSTNASDVPEQCLNANVSDIYTFACPSHGWEAIQRWIYTTVNSFDPEYLALLQEVDTPNWVEVTGHGSQRRLSITPDVSTDPEGYDPEPAVATTQQAVVADALTQTGNLWVHSMSNVSTTGHGSILQRQDAVHAINSGYYQPYSMVSCAKDVIHGPQDDSAVAFPVPPVVDANTMLNQSKYNDSVLDIHSFIYPGITRQKLLGTPGSLTASRLRWVELPQDPFNGSAIGAVILLPRSSTNLTQEIIVCNLGAGWGSSLINTSSFAGGTTFTTSVVDLSASSREKGYNSNTSHEYGVTQAESEASDSVSYYFLPRFPEKRVIVTEAWANYLNPFLPGFNRTVIDALMSTNSPAEELSSLAQVDTAKWALTGLLANGLASIGATGTLQGDIKTVVKPDGSSEFDGDYWFSGKGDVFNVDPEESKDWVKLRVDSTVDGYAYNIQGASPKFAIAFLLSYCIIALSHVIYAGISGKSCWNLPQPHSTCSNMRANEVVSLGYIYGLPPHSS